MQSVTLLYGGNQPSHVQNQLRRSGFQLVRFGGNLQLPGQAPKPAYQLTASAESLILLANTLGERAHEFFISVMGAQGPQLMRLPDYLHQAGRI